MSRESPLTGWRARAAASVERGKSAVAKVSSAVPIDNRLEIDLDTGVPCYPDNVQERGRIVIPLAFATDGAFLTLALIPLECLGMREIVIYKTPAAGAKRISSFLRAYIDAGIFTQAVSLDTYRSESSGKTYWNLQLTHPQSISEDEDLMQSIAALLPDAQALADKALEFKPKLPAKGAPARSRKF